MISWTETGVFCLSRKARISSARVIDYSPSGFGRSFLRRSGTPAIAIKNRRITKTSGQAIVHTKMGMAISEASSLFKSLLKSLVVYHLYFLLRVRNIEMIMTGTEK